MRKAIYIIILVCFCCTGEIRSQSDSTSKLLIGQWKAANLEHIDSKGKVDVDATNHFWQMLEGRTLVFRADGSVEISGYTNCSWHTENNYLYIRYSKEGKWEKALVIKVDDSVLRLRKEVNLPEEGNSQITEYKKQ